MVVTQILGMLIPQKEQDLKKLAQKISYRRILVGMHYPHDIIAGEQLARLILGGLLQNEEFRKDFENARLELEKKPLKNPQTSEVKNEAKEEQNTQPKAEEVKAETPLITPNDQALPAQ